jgi:hypothetical protein
MFTQESPSCEIPTSIWTIEHQIMGGSGPLICGKEVMNLDFGKKEKSHIVNSRVMKSDALRGEAPGFGWRSYGGSIREELRTISPFQGFGNRRSRGDSQ